MGMILHEYLMDEMIYIHKIYKKHYILCNNLYVSLKILISVFFFFGGKSYDLFLSPLKSHASYLIWL